MLTNVLHQGSGDIGDHPAQDHFGDGDHVFKSQHKDQFDGHCFPVVIVGLVRGARLWADSCCPDTCRH